MIDDLIKRYRDAAVAHSEGTQSGNSQKTNRAYDIVTETLREMTKSGCDDRLFSLYEDENVSVQVWAAVHTLELNEKKALLKLQCIVDKGIPILSMGARYSIQEWKNGKLRFRANF